MLHNADEAGSGEADCNCLSASSVDDSFPWQENGGFSAARNSGLRQIYARYIMFLDSDDQLGEGAIESLLSTAYRTDADVVQGGYERILHNNVQSSITLQNNDEATASEMQGFPWGKVYKAELYRHVQFPVGYWYEDTIMAMLIFPEASHFATVADSVYKYTINPAGITATSKGKLKSLDTFYITRSLMKDAATLGLLTWTDFQLNHFFNQVLINYKRTYLLGDQLRRAVFVATCELAKQLPEQPENKLYRALIKRDYALYERCCLMAEW